MKKIYLLLPSLLLLINSFAQEVEFTHDWGGIRVDYPWQTLVDKKGNVIITSYVIDSTFFHSGQLFPALTDTPSNLYSDMLITKFDPSGQVIWNYRLGACNNDGFTLTVDKNNNIIMVGNIWDDYTGQCQFADLDFSNDTAFAGSGGFMAKYDENMNLIWLKKENQNPVGGEMATDADGNIYMTGSVYERADFNFEPNDSLILTSPPFNSHSTYGSAFLAKYDSSGNLLWAHSFGNKFSNHGCKIKISANQIIIAGVFSASVHPNFFNPSYTVATWQHIAYPGVSDGYYSEEPFIASYDLNGNLIWFKPVRLAGKTSYTQLNGLDVDDEGSFYILGSLKGSANFDSSNVAGNIQTLGTPNPDFPWLTDYSYDVYLAKYDAHGTFQWVNTFAQMGDDVACDLTIFDRNHIYISAVLASSINNSPVFPGFDTIAAYQALMPTITNFVGRLDANKASYWLYYANKIRFTNLAVSDANSLFIGAYFYAATTINGIQNNFSIAPYNNGGGDVAFIKLNDYTDSLYNSFTQGNPNFLICAKTYASVDKIDGNGTSTVVLYPNPTADQLNITIDETFNGAQLNIYNTSGVLIHTEHLQTQQSTLSIANFAVGVYIAEIKTSNRLQIVKWIKM